MKNTVVRLSELTIKNIKNVGNGTVRIPQTSNLGNNTAAAILGIYGQNGSGKTAIVDAMFFLQQIMSGKELSAELNDYIDVSAKTAEIKAIFYIFNKEDFYDVEYRIIFFRSEDNIVINKETLKCAISHNGEKIRNKTVFMDYSRSGKTEIFTPYNRLMELVGNNKEIETSLVVAKKFAEISKCSYVFGKNSMDVYEKGKKGDFGQFYFVLKELQNFAIRDFFVIKNSQSGAISANIALQIPFRLENDREALRGFFRVHLKEPSILNYKYKSILEDVIARINIVLETIIPGMQIEIKDYGKQLLDSGEDGWKIELMSVRDGLRKIPIRMESDGIIKIVSILNVLVQCFSNPSVCLVVDELDSGIFEYMLGELLYMFSKNAKGQLIFTSHNLRALEMLDGSDIMFSTVNPNNRYIHMKNVKGSNNLRKMYFRCITLGGQEEEMYRETDTLKMARAFGKAGRSWGDD